MTSELDNRNIAVSMRKSVENLVISSQDAIGQSISQALTFSGVISQHANQMIQAGQDNKNVSRSPSPSIRSNAEINTDLVADYDKSSDVLIQVPTHGAGDAVSLASQASASAPAAARGAEGARSKKKSWYSALYPTYKSRSDDFKRLFKDIPDDERLIVDYSCALQKDILAHGRLYASQNYLCFYANIFGWETSMSLRWKDVTAITKEKTALVIPNAILVCTDSEKNFLTSFSGRDKAYLMLFRVWQNALMDQPMSSQEIWQWVHSCYGDELGFNSEDEGHARDVLEDDKPAPAAEFFLDSSSMEAGGGDDSAEHLDSITAKAYSRPAPELPDSAAGAGAADENGDPLPTDMSDTSDSEPDKHNGAEVERCVLNHDGRQVIKAEIPINIDQMFTMIFTNSQFNLELLAARGASDYIQAAWQHDSQSGLKCRQISYTIGLSSGPIGPKEVYVTETQIMNKCSKPGVMYSIDATSENAGIPYAECFSVLVHYCLRRVSDGITSLSMHSSVKYKKSVWPMVRGFLEKNALGGVDEFGRLLETRLILEAEHAPAKRKSRRRRRPAGGGGCRSASSAEARAAPAGAAPARARAARAGAGRAWWGAALLALLLVNALLYWRLSLQPPARPLALDDLQNRMSELSAEQMSEWSRLLELHSARQRLQLRAWRDALDAAVATLRQTEHALNDLLSTIKPSLEKAQREATENVHTEL